MPSCPQFNLTDSALSGLYCQCNGTASPAFSVFSSLSICPATQCLGICANADISGIGVRIAFYAQSVMNALLVWFSPHDSIPSAWAATCLTIALVIPAMVQKFASNSLTLHHATLVFNFATLSCLSSLAVAPKLPIWRLTPEAYVQHERERQQDLDEAELTASPSSTRASSRDRTPSSAHYAHSDVPVITIEDRGRPSQRDPPPAKIIIMDGRHIEPQQLQKRQQRERGMLSVALLVQVTVQWAWGFVLLLSPEFSQPECVGMTNLVIFFHTFVTRDIQTRTRDGVSSYHLNAIYPLWLVFCLSISMFWAIMLAYSGASQAHDMFNSRNTSRCSSVSRLHLPHPVPYCGAELSSRRMWRARITEVIHKLHNVSWPLLSFQDRSKTLIVLNYIAAFVLWLLFVMASENQIQRNCIFAGENSWSSFGQLAALLLALAPIWPLVAALHERRARNRRKSRRQQHNSETQPMYDPDHVVRGAVARIASHSSQDGLRPPIIQHGRSHSKLSISDTATIAEDDITNSYVRHRPGSGE